ncbi:MAG: hypothetical protein AABZ78_11100 [Chloroflexota bacterium]
MERNLPPEQVNAQIVKLEEEVRRLQAELAVLRSQQVVHRLMEMDGPLPMDNKTIVRTPRGLTIKGTRLTIYSLMDEIKNKASLKYVRDLYGLTDEEMLDVVDYIHLHSEEVEKEYQDVVRDAEENRQYWEERNRERFAAITPEREAFQAKLKEWKKQQQADLRA